MLQNDDPYFDKFLREFLPRIERKPDRLDNDIRDIRLRLGHVETARIHQASEFDRLIADVERIRKHLDPFDA